MTKPGAKPPGARPGDADPWAAVSRDTLAALQGPAVVEDVGDTSELLRLGQTGSFQVGQTGSTDILDALNQSLAAAPERADLWMMRFDTQRMLGLKDDFLAALKAAWQNPRLRRDLDAAALRAMWDELAPGETLPDDIPLPRAAHRFAGPAPGGRPQGSQRFSDLATQLAGAELRELGEAFAKLRTTPGFFQDFARKVGPLLNRPTKLQPAEALAREFGGDVRVFLKREDQRRISAELENAATQAFVAAALGKQFLVTGNDVDRHSLALAEVAPKFGLKCLIVVRPADLERKPDFIARLRARGASVETMARFTLASQDPREAAVRLWQCAPARSYLALSLGTGPAPYPAMVIDFQSSLGHETQLQLRAHAAAGRPRTYVAAVHSEADSIGFVLPLLAKPDAELLYAEPERGSDAAWQPSERLAAYNGAIREHAWLRATGRITHVTIPDGQAYEAQRQIARIESAKIGLEDARSVALAGMLARRNVGPRDLVVLVA